MPKAARGSSSLSGWVSKFWFAVENNDVRTVRSLLSQGADVNHVFKVIYISYSLLIKLSFLSLKQKLINVNIFIA